MRVRFERKIQSVNFPTCACALEGVCIFCVVVKGYVTANKL